MVYRGCGAVWHGAAIREVIREINRVRPHPAPYRPLFQTYARTDRLGKLHVVVRPAPGNVPEDFGPRRSED